METSSASVVTPPSAEGAGPRRSDGEGSAPEPEPPARPKPPPLPREARRNLLPKSSDRSQWIATWPAEDPRQEIAFRVLPGWRRRPLLALARAADSASLVELSSLLAAWAHTGGKRPGLAARERDRVLALRLRGEVWCWCEANRLHARLTRLVARVRPLSWRLPRLSLARRVEHWRLQRSLGGLWRVGLRTLKRPVELVLARALARPTALALPTPDTRTDA